MCRSNNCQPLEYSVSKPPGNCAEAFQLQLLMGKLIFSLTFYYYFYYFTFCLFPACFLIALCVSDDVIVVVEFRENKL